MLKRNLITAGAAVVMLLSWLAVAPAQAALVDFESAAGSDNEDFVDSNGMFAGLDWSQNGDLPQKSRWEIDTDNVPFDSLPPFCSPALEGTRWVQGFAEGVTTPGGGPGDPNRAKFGWDGTNAFEFHSLWLRTRFTTDLGGSVDTANGGDGIDDRWLTSIEVLFRDTNNNESTVTIDLTNPTDPSGWIELTAADVTGAADLSDLKAVFFFGDSGTTVAGVRNDRFGLDNLNITLAGLSDPVCPFCGDGQVDVGEECDDGNDDINDGCRPNCTQEVCGDNIIDLGEQCDDGNLIDGDGCQANCALPICGDSILDPGLGEQCDDGNNDAGDGCSATCQTEVCGNTIIDPGEECDDGNTQTGDGCRPDCTQELCGDGILDEPPELCDDGNNDAGDGCRADCTVEICGDGIRDPQEQCDDGNLIDGDGCQANCKLPLCGDNIVDPDEQCDDGNTTAGDGCSPVCKTEVCGNGIQDPFEACDDGNLVPGDGCRANCTVEACGDNILDPQEQCDDGNNVSGDGCSEFCETEMLGGGEGCWPYFWKQRRHFDSWPAPYVPGRIPQGGTPFADVFEDAFRNQSLSQVLRRSGGALNALGRQTVAALLNAASSEVSYDLTESEVIDMFNQTYPGTKRAYRMLERNFRRLNKQVCPLNSHCGGHCGGHGW